jgi:Zn-dependent M16 (insulinase) family peptidase
MGEGSAELFRHAQTGCEVLVHRIKDPDKVLCIAFSTPHDSSNGLPHILEHLVLAGSEKFPVSDPFFTTVKGSFKTFLNASTWPECTFYPVGTTNFQEFLNLGDIYLDAVFHPLLKVEKFAQEGWRLERNAEGEFVFNGVVYNEMKGALSSPTTALYREVCAALFPDTHRGKIAAGDPVEIPQLSYAELKRYHELHYHPSRARIVVHGDFSEAQLSQVFDRIAANIGSFSQSDFTPVLKSHTPKAGHREIIVPFPQQPDQLEGAPLASLAWPLGRVDALDDRMLWEVVERVLLGGESSPLQRELLARRATKQVVLSGSVLGSLDAFFLVSGKDVSAENPNQFIKKVRTILSEIVRDGLPQDEVEAALSGLEFALREGSADSPRGLEFAESFVPKWLLGQGPLQMLDRLSSLGRVRDLLANKPRLLEDLIEQRLLNNPESVSVILQPSHEQYDRVIRDEKERVQAFVAALSDGEIAKIEACNERMLQQQRAGDDPQLLEKLPSLSPSDIPDKLAALDTVTSSEVGRVVVSSTDTAGISYGQLAFDISGMPEELLCYAPFMARLVGSVDTEKRSFVDFDRAVRIRTGGISAYVDTGIDQKSMLGKAFFMLSGRALSERAGELFDLMQEAVFASKFDKRGRFVELLDEAIANRELSVTREGHRFAIAEAIYAASAECRYASLLEGFGQTRFLHGLRARVNSDWEGVQADLERFASAFSLENVRLGLCADESQLERSAFLLVEAYKSLPSQGGSLEIGRPPVANSPALQVGLPINTEVAYLGIARQLSESKRRGLNGALLVAMRALTYDYYIPEVRQRSGAYGAGAFYRGLSGIVGGYTYRSRNAHIAADIETMLGGAKFLARHRLTSTQVGKLIVGVISEWAPYKHPSDAAGSAFSRACFNIPAELREEWYQEIRACTPAQVKQVGELLIEGGSPWYVRVVSSTEALASAGLAFESH